ncbi:hypothetical protein [Paenibacillus taichungensis]
MKIKNEMPESLVDIVRIDKEIRERHDETFQDYVGFYISFNNDDDRYYCTPDDAIVFGRTGVDGDHFAFFRLTDQLVIWKKLLLFLFSLWHLVIK